LVAKSFDVVQYCPERVVALCRSAETVVTDDRKPVTATRKGNIQALLFMKVAKLPTAVRPSDGINANVCLPPLQRIHGVTLHL
jgi:hypothetical protein